MVPENNFGSANTHLLVYCGGRRENEESTKGGDTQRRARAKTMSD